MEKNDVTPKVEEVTLYHDGETTPKCVYHHINHVLTGKLERFDAKGARILKAHYLDGQLCGDFYVFVATVLQRHSVYQKNALHGKTVLYHPNGMINQVEHYEAGQLEGLRENYDEQGHMLQRQTYRQGRLHGPAWHYFPSGQVFMESHYSNDLLVDTKRIYFPSGVLKEEIPYDENKINGKQSVYFESGQLKESKEYKENVLDGKEIIYNKTGVCLEKNQYRMGKKAEMNDPAIQNKPSRSSVHSNSMGSSGLTMWERVLDFFRLL